MLVCPVSPLTASGVGPGATKRRRPDQRSSPPPAPGGRSSHGGWGRPSVARGRSLITSGGTPQPAFSATCRNRHAFCGHVQVEGPMVAAAENVFMNRSPWGRGRVASNDCQNGRCSRIVDFATDSFDRHGVKVGVRAMVNDAISMTGFHICFGSVADSNHSYI